VTELLDQTAADLAATADRLLGELDRVLAGATGLRGECRPALDVLEKAATLEVVMDLPGIPAEALRVAIRRNAIVIVGAKLPRPPSAPARFHLAERSFGRFARVVRVAGAFDASRARAVAAAGVLRITLPRVTERRGQVFDVSVDRG